MPPIVAQFSCRDAGRGRDFFAESDSIDAVVHHVQDHAERNNARDPSRADVEDHGTEA